MLFRSLRVYSDYFGRTDAEPYASGADGCGSLEMVTNGLKIRRALNTDETEPKFMLSFQDIWKGLNPIHNLGMGVEPDPNRANFEWLRIEPFQYFYDSNVLATFTNIKETTREIDTDQIYSIFNGGFTKFETETAGGLNDIHAKRNWRTTLNTVKKALQQVSDFIASGHSIEITRWQVGATSQDWRYDNDTFIICVVRDAEALGGYRVQRGEDMPPADNLPNYQTCYNVLISPQRNARRWTPIIVQCYVDYINGIIKYMDGSGNLIASTYIPPTNADCLVQDDTLPLVNMPENADISLSGTAAFPYDPSNVGDFYPIKKPELIRFEYPLTFEQWKTIKAAPTGTIEFQCGNGALESGWISEINYKLKEGMAEFVLIPQIASQIQIG